MDPAATSSARSMLTHEQFLDVCARLDPNGYGMEEWYAAALLAVELDPASRTQVDKMMRREAAKHPSHPMPYHVAVAHVAARRSGFCGIECHEHQAPCPDCHALCRPAGPRPRSRRFPCGMSEGAECCRCGWAIDNAVPCQRAGMRPDIHTVW
jgi:hypothetical protein